MEPAIALPLGSRIEDFEVERLLSSDGAFGLVYLAYDHRPDRVSQRQRKLEQQAALRRSRSTGRPRPPSAGPRLVLKEFYPQELAQRRAGEHTVVPKPRQDQLYAWSRSRFLDEANFLLQHVHPNVVTVFDVLSANNTHYMLMELLDGGSLETLVRSCGGQGEAEVRRWLLPVLRALESTAAEGVDHLDLSPQNVMFRTAGGDPVLIDFGAARMRAPAEARASRLIVNDGYAAPEKYHHTSQELSARADVYALAALVNFALTGERPASAVERLSGPSLARGLRQGALETRARRASGRFLAAIDQAFDLEPRRRLADASAFERALAPWPEDPAGRAPPAPARTPRSPARPQAADEGRRRVQVVFLGLLTLLLLLLLLGPALAGSCGHQGCQRGDRLGVRISR